MSNIEKRLRASVKIDAINGNRFDREICSKQMLEAAQEIERLRAALVKLTRLDPPETVRANVRVVVYGRSAREFALEVLGRTP